jgi:hypothetical protein
MASVIHKTPNPDTLQYTYLHSVNTPDYDPAYWLHNPDVHDLANSEVPQMYWKTESYVEDEETLWRVVEMSASEKAAVDAKIPPVPPTMLDGRPIIRADSRPMNFQTYYTMAGDDSTAGIGMGEELVWDFSNDNNIVTGDHVPSGMKCKEFIITFICPIYTKDGCIYFFDSPWGCYIMMDVVIPPGQWYPNPAGTVPAAALGLSDGLMYANTGADWVTWTSYVMKYRIHGDCPMGDELNAEGSSVNPIPPGWGIRGRIYTPNSDNISKGYAELELHRCHAAVLPGQTVQDIIDSH